MSIVEISDKVSKSMMVMAAAWAFILTFIIIADITSRSSFQRSAQRHARNCRQLDCHDCVPAGRLCHPQPLHAERGFLIDLFPPRVRRVALAFGYLLGAAFFLMVVLGSWDLAIDSWVTGEFEGEGAMHIPSWPTRFMILIGSGLAVLNYLVLAFLDVLGPFSAAEKKIHAAKGLPQ